MAYCTVEQVRGVLARDVAQATGTAAGLFDVDILEYHIGAAQAEIDGRVAGRYVTPFPDPVPALIASVTVDVAAWLATLTYRQSKDIAADDPVRLRYERAFGLMQGLSDGSIDLPPGHTPGDGGAETAGGASTRNPYLGKLFGPDDFGLSAGPRRVDGWRGW